MNTVHPLLSAIIDEFEASADHLTFRGYQRREACTNWRIAGKPVLAEPAEAHASYNDVDTLRRQAVEMADEIDAKDKKIKQLEGEVTALTRPTFYCCQRRDERIRELQRRCEVAENDVITYGARTSIRNNALEEAVAAVIGKYPIGPRDQYKTVWQGLRDDVVDVLMRLKS